MASIPVIKFPVLIAYTSIASVKPQGSKKDIAPAVNIDHFEISPSPTFFERNFGSVMEILPILGDILVRFNPKTNITPPTSNVILHKNTVETLINDPNSPKSPPSIEKPMILPK